jgi:hypothetical protein
LTQPIHPDIERANRLEDAETKALRLQLANAEATTKAQQESERLERRRLADAAMGKLAPVNTAPNYIAVTNPTSDKSFSEILAENNEEDNFDDNHRY